MIVRKTLSEVTPEEIGLYLVGDDCSWHNLPLIMTHNEGHSVFWNDGKPHEKTFEKLDDAIKKYKEIIGK